MKPWHWIVIGVVIAGMFSGPGALEAGAAAQPPIEWSDIPFVFVGGALGMLFVIGIQLFRREPKPSKWALWLLGPASLYFVASGLSAVLLAASRGGVAPHAVLFLRSERAHFWVLGFLGFFIVGASNMRSNMAFERDAPKAARPSTLR